MATEVDVIKAHTDVASVQKAISDWLTANAVSDYSTTTFEIGDRQTGIIIQYTPA